MRFRGENGTKPSTQARRYVWESLVTTLTEDILRGAGYLTDVPGGDEFDRRRVHAAAAFVLKTLQRHAKGYAP